MFENFVGLAYSWYVLGYFFDSNTPTWGKMGVRTVVQPLVNKFCIELSWRAGLHLDRSLGVRLFHTHVMFAYFGSFMTTMARLMQGSAATFTESVLLELSGTAAELFTAHSLLKGNTPLSSILETSAKIQRAIRTETKTEEASNRAQVAPAGVSPPPVAGAPSPRELSTEERREFCGSALVQISIFECTSIFASSGLFLFLSINPGQPGSRAIPLEQSLVNLAVMLFGELVVTDAIIAYAARRWSSKNDPIKHFFTLKKRKRLLWGIIATEACVLSASLLAFPNNFCYTSWRGGGEPTGEDREWVLTQCPLPPDTASDLFLVGDYYGTNN
jgi:hypothetical protein